MMVRPPALEGHSMANIKVAITLDEATLRRVDGLVRAARYRDRSQAIEAAVKAELGGLDRLATECAKLDPTEEKSLAEEGVLAGGGTWPTW
jgi:Arc/MetJ-type ribon-helix-helix transcriptional regulator